jgi:hypothetical protein
MAIVIILGLILFILSSGLAYLVLFLPTQWFVKPDKLKIVRLVLSPFIVLLIVAFYSFVPTSSNDDTATMEKIGNDYEITLTGQRAYMAHDPISALSRDTYSDTFKIIVPRAQGVINGQEITTEKGYYKMLGMLDISKDKMTIDLYADNYDDKTKDPIIWNGEYKLKRKGGN